MEILKCVLWLAFAGSGAAQTYPRQYRIWPSSEIHQTIVQLGKDYPNLIAVKTSQDAFGLPSAGASTDCPFDGSSVGCLNYFGIIQDYVAHPVGSASSNRLPTVLLSGALHGDERVGPTVVMETAMLLLKAAACEANQVTTCRQVLTTEQGLTDKQRRWLARLVTSRRIVIVPTANALGYYQNNRFENGYDPNRDFPYDQSSTLCMNTIAARTLNEIFRSNIVQFSFTFHAGIDLIGYEWGALPYLKNPISPDDTAQAQLASGFSRFAGGWSGQRSYPIGAMNKILYPVRGGMEDWAYAGSWDTAYIPKCNPSSNGGYAAEKTVYNSATLRAFNILVETSSKKLPTSGLGTSKDVLVQGTSGNGHVSRNIRLSVSAIDTVEPYLSIVGVNSNTVLGDFRPLKARSCNSLPTVKVAASTKKVTVYWTVGGAISIDQTQAWIAPANNASTAVLLNCVAQPSTTMVSKVFVGGTKLSGAGFLASGGPIPSNSSTIGPGFASTITLPTSSGSGGYVVMVSARVDSSWASQPSTVAPDIPPQSHMANVRTNPSWKHVNGNNVVRGRLVWYSMPIRITR